MFIINFELRILQAFMLVKYKFTINDNLLILTEKGSRYMKHRRPFSVLNHKDNDSDYYRDITLPLQYNGPVYLPSGSCVSPELRVINAGSGPRTCYSGRVSTPDQYP